MITSQHISKGQVVSQVGGNVVSDMGGEKVMLSIHNGKYYNLGEIGGDIWEHIQEPITVQNLIASLTDRYDVADAICEEQVLSFLSHLIEEGLVQVKTESPS